MTARRGLMSTLHLSGGGHTAHYRRTWSRKMTIERILLLQNVGQFDNVSSGAQVPLTPFSVIYAENGRGKTTLSAILKSLASGDPSLIQNRKRLNARHEPHVIVQLSGATAIFKGGAWSAT